MMTITDNFSAVYDAAMDARAEIADALKEVPYDNSGIAHCLLTIGDNVEFKAHIIGRTHLFGDDIYERTYTEGRDATVEEIKACTERVLAALRLKTREGRIAQLREELKQMEGSL